MQDSPDRLFDESMNDVCRESERGQHGKQKCETITYRPESAYSRCAEPQVKQVDRITQPSRQSKNFLRSSCDSTMGTGEKQE